MRSDRERTVFHQVETHAQWSVRALPDAHLGWSGPSGVNNKQASTMDNEAEYMG